MDDLRNIMESGAAWFRLVEAAMRRDGTNDELRRLDVFLDGFAVDLNNLRSRLRLRLGQRKSYE